MGKYSEIVDITANNTNDENTVMFSEEGQIGSGGVQWRRSKLGDFTFHKDQLEKEFLDTMLNEQKCSSCHSLTFLAWLKKLADILEKTDPITFSIRADHPMKVEMQFDKLGSSSLEYFLAPRATRDDDEFEEFD